MRVRAGIALCLLLGLGGLVYFFIVDGWASPDFPDTTLRLSSPAVRTLLG